MRIIGDHLSYVMIPGVRHLRELACLSWLDGAGGNCIGIGLESPAKAVITFA